MTATPWMSDDWLTPCLQQLSRARVTVFGDFCVDAYWQIDPDESERSIETSLPVRRVRAQRYSLGGAGNVAANLAALEVAQVRAVSLVGHDLFGWQMLRLLGELNIDASGMLRVQEDWQTLVYSKPCLGPRELNRIDFGAFNAPSPAAMDALAAEVDRSAGLSDAVILNQQVPAGLSTPTMIDRLNEVIASHPSVRFIVDSRHRAELYRGAILKLNAHEAARVLGQDIPLEQAIESDRAGDLALRLRERTGRSVFLTRGQAGILVADGGGLHEIPGIHVPPPIDTVGAGDTVLGALAAVLAVGGQPALAAALANIAASVTVRKLQTTGSASRPEILAVGPVPDYVYLPELADDADAARLVDGTRIEIVRDRPRGHVRHALFDHDGTISTLRQGWEAVMERVMLRCILGPAPAAAETRRRAERRVAEVIETTTGRQTLVQMQALAEMVREFGLVPAEQVLELHGYKAIYNRELMAMVGGRLDQVRAGRRPANDFLIPGAVEFLRALAHSGVRLYLASGTDADDVRQEAEALGYAALFEGRIYGAVGDIRVEAKHAVVQSILREHGLAGRGLAIFGDGPVEMREARRCDALAVGVASDEVNLGRLHPDKRRRLIHAGADRIIPDYTDAASLLPTL